MQTVIREGGRLYSAVPHIAKGARVADIGTDHAYLPIHLVKEGIVKEALAADINQGPIDSAHANIAAAGLADKIQTLKTDGLHGVDAFAPDHILIFGMGGELIIRILSEAPWIKNAGIKLILQPMSRAHLLRAYLLDNGFAITGETLTLEDKYYQTVVARYEGETVKNDYSTEELLIGRLNLQSKPPLLRGFLEHEIGVLKAVLAGKSKSARADTSNEETLLSILLERLEK